MHNEKTESYKELFTHNVKWLRKHHGLSLKQMAEILGIGVETLRKLERGELPPKLSVSIVFAIHKQFNISAGDIMGKWFD